MNLAKNQAKVTVKGLNEIKKNIGIGNNLASIAVSLPTAKQSRRVVEMENLEEHILNRIDDINADWKNATTVVDHLGHLKNIFMMEVPKSFRPSLFRMLNNLVSALMQGYGENQKIFRASFNMMTQLKELVDKNPQYDEMAAENEWQEFERCVYLLSDWEDLIQYGNEVEGIPLHIEK